MSLLASSNRRSALRIAPRVELVLRGVLPDPKPLLTLSAESVFYADQGIKGSVASNLGLRPRINHNRNPERIVSLRVDRSAARNGRDICTGQIGGRDLLSNFSYSLLI